MNSLTSKPNKEKVYLQALLNTSTIGMVITKPNGNFIDVNQQFVKITGYSKKELCRLNFRDITHPDDIETENRFLEEILITQVKSFTIEKRYITKNDQIIWVNVKASIVFDNKENPDVIIGAIEDITEKKQKIKELEKSKVDYKNALKFTQAILNAVPDPISVQDSNFNIVQYNQTGYEFANKTYEQVVGKKCYEIMGRATQCKICPTQEAKMTKKIVRKEKYFPKVDKWFDARAYPILSANNDIVYMIEHLRDITNIKKAEEELKKQNRELIMAKQKAEESDKLKTAFLHNISHEIRTPLNGIIGFSRLLKKESDKVGDKQISNYTDIISKSGWRLSSIINDLVSISSIESGVEKVNIDKTDINELMLNIYSNFQIKANEKRVSLFLKNELQELKYISTDETKLFEIISNLVNNAIKFTNIGYVELSASVLQNKLKFYVKDTGIGIPKEYHKNIFKRFEQLNTKSNNSLGGSGLGLAISKAYVELLGGKIWLESQPDKGTTFHFTIPLQKEERTDEENNRGEITYNNIQGGKITILLAEDDEVNYMLFAEIVKDLDVKLIHAKNGEEAINICKQEQKIDIIFMDIKMPIIDGHEATKQIKQIKPEIPIITISAYFEDKEREVSLKIGSTDYLAKPIKREDVVEIIQKITIQNMT